MDKEPQFEKMPHNRFQVMKSSPKSSARESDDASVFDSTQVQRMRRADRLAQSRYRQNDLGGSDNLDYILNSPEGFEEAQDEVNKSHSFPVFVFFVALVKDTVDISFFGTVGVLIAPFAIFIIAIWMFGKGSMFKKLVIRRYLKKRALAAAAIELTPGLSILPVYTILVLYVHYRETKFIKELEYIVVQAETGRAISFDKIREIAYA